MHSTNGHHDEPNQVDPSHACPQCGERDADRLEWFDDDNVRCTTCGHTYSP
jgi:DNA-directed RNA polymerase subunit RPC12/RpoP